MTHGQQPETLWVILGIALWAGTSDTMAADWPQWRGPDRNGQVADAITVSDDLAFAPLWKVQVGTGFSSIAVVGDRVYTMGNIDNHDIIWCLNRGDGSVIWKQQYAAPVDPNLYEGGPNATPTVSEGRVLTFSRKGDVYCLDAQTGEIHWNLNVVERMGYDIPSWGFTGSPLVIGDKVLLNAGHHGLCLRVDSGEVVWQSDNSEEAGYSSPRLVDVNGSPLVLLFSGKALHAVELADGEVRWSYPWITRYGVNAADPFPLDEEHVLISSGYGKGTALLKYVPDGVEEVWRKREPRNQMTPGLLLGETLYAVDGDAGGERSLVCMDARTGEIHWEEPGFGSATMLAIGPHIFLLSDGGELVLIEPSTTELKILRRGTILDGKCWTSPAYADGSLFARNAAGDLVRVRLQPGETGS